MRYIAFLRAINISGHYVKMDVLRQSFEALQLQDVQTYIQSGNVLFSDNSTPPETLRQKIEAQLLQDLGYPVPTFLRTDADLLALHEHQPFSAVQMGENSVIYVGFLHQEPDSTIQTHLLGLSNEIDQFAVYKDHVFWLEHKHLGKSKITTTRLEKVLGMPSTLRNTSTIQKMVAKYFSGNT